MPSKLHSKLLENLATFLEDEQPYLLHLLGGVVSASWDISLSSLEPMEATFDGYDPITLAGAVAEVRPGKEQWQIAWPEQTFTAGGSMTPTYIHGLWIATDEMTPRILKVELFPAPILLDAPGAEIRHTPVIVIGHDIDIPVTPPPPPGDEIYCNDFAFGLDAMDDTGDAGTVTVAGGVCSMVGDGSDTDADYAEVSYTVGTLPDNFIGAVNCKINSHTGDDGASIFVGGTGPGGDAYLYGVLSETSGEITFYTWVGVDVERETIPIPAGWFQMSIEFELSGNNLIFNVNDGTSDLGPWVVPIGGPPAFATAWFGFDLQGTTDTLDMEWDDFCMHDLDA